MRRIGWTVLYQDKVSGRPFSFSINEHDQGYLVGMPILVMDVFEHAYMLDYGWNGPIVLRCFKKTLTGRRPRPG